MKQQILIVHGGHAYSKYDLFIEYLRTVEIETPVTSYIYGWKDYLQQNLGEKYEIFYPRMPNAQNSKYKEWKIWFERHLEFLHDGAILIGHSLGGYFLAKYLSENKINVDLRSVYLVAAVYESDNFNGEDGGDFAFNPDNLSNVVNSVDKIYILHSKDDPVVPYSHALKFKERLPNAQFSDI